VVFVLIGAPIGMLTRKGNIGVAALISAGVLTVYFIAIIQGEKLADRMIISPFMGMWGINIFLLIVGILLTLHVSTAFRISNLWNRDE
jgi:lipopolysaccharide export system permease protein